MRNSAESTLPTNNAIMDENKPLLQWQHTPGGIESFKEQERKGSFGGSALNLLTCAIGSGVLSLPFAFKSAGLLFGPLLLMAVSFVNLYSLHLLVLCSYNTQKHTYQEVAIAAFGRRFGRIVVDVILFLTSFGALVGFTVIMGDLMVPVVCQWSGYGADCPDTVFYVNRNFLAAVLIVVCIAPVAYRHTFSEFVVSSALALGSVIFLIVAVVWRSIEHLVAVEHPEIPSLFYDDAFGIIDAIPLITFALGCHIQVIPIYSELRPAINTVGWMDGIILTSNTTTTSLYMIISLFGLLHFGPDTNGNILLNYPPSDILLMVARLLMAIHVALAYPLQSWAARNVLDHLLFQGSDEVEEDSKKKLRKKNIKYIIMTTCILVGAFIGAAVIPDITIIFGFIGCIGSTFANFIFPGIFYLKLLPGEPIAKRVPALLLVIAGLCVGSLGTASLAYQQIQQIQG